MTREGALKIAIEALTQWSQGKVATAVVLAAIAKLEARRPTPRRPPKRKLSSTTRMRALKLRPSNVRPLGSRCHPPDIEQEYTEVFEEREIAAYHEAGHAVIARALDIEVACVAIIPFMGRIGHVWHEKASPKTEILITMAGPFAEARFTGRLLCAGDDEANITSAMTQLPEPREHYEAKAKTLVAESWRAIEIVAEELLIGAGRLYGPMLDLAICCAAPGVP